LCEVINIAYNDYDIAKFSPGWASSYGTAQKGEEQNLLSGYTNYIQGLESIPATADRYSNQFFIPQLQEEALRLGELGTGLTSQIKGMPGQVADTSRESLLTEAQKQGMIQAKSQPLYENLADVNMAAQSVGARLSAGQQALGQMLGYEMAQRLNLIDLLPTKMQE